MPKCVQCGCQWVVKNGHIHNGRQRYLCPACQRQFVLNPTHETIDPQTKETIDKLLREKISLRGIVRVCAVSLSWLLNYVNQKYNSTPKEVNVKKTQRLTVECDEM